MRVQLKKDDGSPVNPAIKTSKHWELFFFLEAVLVNGTSHYAYD